MTSAEIIAALEQRFAGKIKSKNAEAIDPFVVIEPADLVEVCRYLRDDPKLKFEMLNCISGVDYLEPDAKKAPKAGFEPHLRWRRCFNTRATMSRRSFRACSTRWCTSIWRASCLIWRIFSRGSASWPSIPRASARRS